MTKVKLFTHTDLDGVSCAVIFKYLEATEDYKVDITYNSYQNIDDNVNRFLDDENEYDKYDQIYITDISVNKDTAKRIDKLSSPSKIHLFDHHESSSYLNKYKWAISHERLFGGLTCGTLLLYRILILFKILEDKGENSSLAVFTNIVNLWDTWLWKTDEENGIVAKRLNTLFRNRGIDKFIEWAVDKLINNQTFDNYNDIFDEVDKAVIEVIEDKEEYYVVRAIANASLIEFKDYKAALVIAEEQTSNIADRLLEYNKDVDICIVVNFSINTCSLRTKRDNINLSTIAKEYGGGGHPQAAGFVIDSTFRDNYLFAALGKNFRRYLENEEIEH